MLFKKKSNLTSSCFSENCPSMEKKSGTINIYEKQTEHYHKLYSKLSWPWIERCVFVFEADVF